MLGCTFLQEMRSIRLCFARSPGSLENKIIGNHLTFAKKKTIACSLYLNLPPPTNFPIYFNNKLRKGRQAENSQGRN